MVLVPESGDEVQLMKAGIIEIADIFVINKSDRPGQNVFLDHYLIFYIIIQVWIVLFPKL